MSLPSDPVAVGPKEVGERAVIVYVIHEGLSTDPRDLVTGTGTNVGVKLESLLTNAPRCASHPRPRG